MTLFDRTLARRSDIHIWRGADRIERCAPDALLARARGVAEFLAAAGVGRGDTVLIAMPTSVELIVTILAAWSCRAAVCLAPFHAGDATRALDGLKLNATLRLLHPRVVVHEGLDEARLVEAAPTVLSAATLAALPPAAAFPDDPRPEDVAVIQLTSGSTADPKGIALTHDRIVRNLTALDERASLRKADHMLSWVPLFHDMGLHALTLALTYDIQVTLLPTAHFLRSPMSWLEAVTRQRATLSPNPTFAYPLVARLAGRAARTGIDLSTLRCAWVGAEPIQSGHLLAFESAMAPFGLQPNVVQPIYGMAETVVGISQNHAGTPYRLLDVAATALRRTHRVVPVPPGTPGAQRLVSNGKPLLGVRIRIRRADGSAADADEMGHLWVQGEYVAEGYLGGIDPGRFVDGWFDTGDLGFLHEGEVYITGRSKDVIIRGGANFSPAHVEWAVEQDLGLRSGQVVAFSVPDPGQGPEQIVVLVASRGAGDLRDEQVARIIRLVATAVGLAVDAVVFVPGARIPRTTSGKLRRATAREMYLSRQFEEAPCPATACTTP